MDTVTRALLILELVLLSVADGTAVVLPRGLCMQAIALEQFAAFKEELSGLNAEMLPAVQARLIELGLASLPPGVLQPAPQQTV